MRKLSTILGAGVFALSLGGVAVAQDQNQQQREEAYQAALAKCQSLPQAEQQKCVDAAKKKFGQM